MQHIVTDPTKSPRFNFVNLDQGTQEWLRWRSQGIGASDAPTIMGENPWKSAGQLLEEKCGLRESASSHAMARGSSLEPLARSMFESKFGIAMKPACLQSIETDWLRASVDGISADAKRVVEIKCGESVYRRTALERRVPTYYMGQLQHIMAVTGLGLIDFWCYLPNRSPLHLAVPRDENYIARLFDMEHAFWVRLVERRNHG